jgi:DNA adenine methylase
LDTIRDLIPENYTTYYEPFLGGASVFLDINPEHAVVGDINPELINMYIQVRDDVETVISYLETLDIDHESAQDKKAFYYRIRDDFTVNRGCNTPTQAARFIYINKHCFNGLYRIDSNGEFNVPFNGRLIGDSFDPDHMRAVSQQIQGIDFKCQDFEETLMTAGPGSFCFIDSPYTPLTPTSFKGHTKEEFTHEDHVRLARLIKKLTDRGVKCLLTNHNTGLIRDLYKDYNIQVVDTRRSINRDANNRTGKDVIITNY